MVDKDFQKQLTDNLKRPGGLMNVGGAMVATLDLKFGANPQMSLEATSNIVLFYKTVVRATNNDMIQWDPIIEDFKKEWVILVKRKVEDVSDMSDISKLLPIIKWKEYFDNFLN